ncbi:MAG: DUF6231 family protein [Gammaproteobacteria bacterium]
MSPVPRRLDAIVAKWAPASALVIGTPAGPEPPLGTVTRLDPGQAAEQLASLGRFDCALVRPDETLEGRGLVLVLGRLKNVHAPRIALELAVSPPAGLRNALLDLAFEPDAEAEDLWVHDIDRYNPQREWNNPDNWANPENFHKYRW